MILIETKSCANKLEAKTIEREFIEQLNAKLNQRIPSSTGKEYRDDNKERISTYNMQYRIEHKDDLKDKRKSWYNANHDKILEKQKEYREEHLEERRAMNREYIQKHKDRIYPRQAEKLQCECGCLVRRGDLARHRKTLRHLSQNTV